MWGHSRFVLGAIGSFLEPLCGHLSPKIDKVSEELTLKYPHKEPCVVGEFVDQRGDNLKGSNDFYVKVEAIIWAQLSDM